MASTSHLKLAEPLLIKLASMGFAGFKEQAVLQEQQLLVVERQGFSENYTRLAFADISGLLVSRDRRWLYWCLIPVVEIMTALLMVWYVIRVQAWMPLAIFWVWIALAVVKLLWNLAAGPTCTVILQTAAQQMVLKPLHRWRNIQTKLAPLKTRILSAQGVSSDPADVDRATMLALHPQTTAWDRGRWHQGLLFCQVGVMSSLVGYYLSGFKICFALFFLSLAATGLCALVAIRRQSTQPSFGLLAGAAWASLSWWFMTLVIFFGTLLYVTFIDELALQQFSIEPYVHYFQVDLRSYDMVVAGYSIALIVGLGLFVTTLVGLFEYRSRLRRGLS